LDQKWVILSERPNMPASTRRTQADTSESMIVRINQFEPANAEPYSGWGDDGLRGAILYDWPDDTHAFEVLILESDERQRQLAASFRQTQLRRLLPEVLAALAEPGEQIVARLDGPLATNELLGAMKHLSDTNGQGRFAVSGCQRLQHDAPPPIASIRMHLSFQRLAILCMDPNAGLDSDVRLRVFLLPEAQVNDALEANELDDERWPGILSGAGIVLGTMRSMQSIYLMTRRLDSTQARQRILKRLLGTTTTPTT
jgi:hypothetical protein